MKNLLEYKPIENLLNTLNQFLPKLLGAILFFLLSWLLLKLILFVVKKSLKLTKIDLLVSKLLENGSIFSTAVTIQPTKIILTFVKWFFILVFIIVGADILGLTIVSNEVGRIIGYLPRVFSSFVIFGFGLYLANLLRKSTKTVLSSFDLNGSNIISRIVYYIVFLIVAILALNQSGINTEVITDNISIILGAFLVAVAISLGLGSREIVLRLLYGFYARKNFEIGQRIKVDNFEGNIVAIDNISMVIENEQEKRVYPISEISNKLIEIV